MRKSTAEYLEGTENISYSFDNDSKQEKVISFELFNIKTIILTSFEG